VRGGTSNRLFNLIPTSSPEAWEAEEEEAAWEEWEELQQVAEEEDDARENEARERSGARGFLAKLTSEGASGWLMGLVNERRGGAGPSGRAANGAGAVEGRSPGAGRRESGAGAEGAARASSGSGEGDGPSSARTTSNRGSSNNGAVGTRAGLAAASQRRKRRRGKVPVDWLSGEAWGWEEVRDEDGFGPSLRPIVRLGFFFTAVPLLLSTLFRFAVVEPFILPKVEETLQARGDQGLFTLTSEQEEKIADRIHALDKRWKYDALVGTAPQLSDQETMVRLREEGEAMEREALKGNRRIYANILADLSLVTVASGTILLNTPRAAALRRGFYARFLQIKSSSQAFFLLLVSDTLVGYHSADGWSTILNLVAQHYGIQESEAFINLFVAIVPVSIDVIFKWWVFSSLRKISPTTQVILSEIQ